MNVLKKIYCRNIYLNVRCKNARSQYFLNEGFYNNLKFVVVVELFIGD